MTSTKASKQRSEVGRQWFSVADLNGIKIATGWSWSRVHRALSEGEPGLVDLLAAVAEQHRAGRGAGDQGEEVSE